MEDTKIPNNLQLKRRNKLFLFPISYFLFQLFVFSSFAQKLEIGTGVGNLQYKGDLFPAYRPFEMNPGGNIFVRYNISRAVSIKLNGLAGYMWVKDSHVDKPLNQLRNFGFERDVEEGALQFEYNFLNFRTTASRIRSNWTPYVFAAYALSRGQHIILWHQYVGSSTSSKPLNKQTQYAIPFGIGFKKQWHDKWNWGIEFGARKLFKDEFDGFGYRFVDDAVTGKKELSSTFATNATAAVNPLDRKIYSPTTRLNDMYFYTNIYVSYVFYKVHCPKRR